MAYIRIVVIVVAVFSALSARGQDIFCRLDSLIGNRQYATAYPLAQEQYRQALQKGGSNLLSSAFYLTALDYAYSKSPEDSALARYSRLTRRLQGADRAVAYVFLYQTYRKLYERFSYRMRHGNKPSDDPELLPARWHWQRMEDTLRVCADSVLAQAEVLRTADVRNYGWTGVGETGMPVADSSLLGTLVQALFSPCHAFSDSLELSLHRRVSALYADGSDEMRLWLDLNRLEGNYHDSVLAALDSLAEHFFVSKYHISHTFKEHLGISVHQYLLRKRLAACRDAIMMNEKISEVCLTYGFKDYPSFFRAFRKAYGMSPKEYREAFSLSELQQD